MSCSLGYDCRKPEYDILEAANRQRQMGRQTKWTATNESVPLVCKSTLFDKQETKTDRQRDRHKDKQTDKQTVWTAIDKSADKWKDRQIDRQKDKEWTANDETAEVADRQTDESTEVADRQTERQMANRHTDKPRNESVEVRQTDGQTDRNKSVERGD